MILVTPKQEIEWKSEWFCVVNFFLSNCKVEWENGVWTKICFLASGFLFTCDNFTLIFTVFRFFGLHFFLNGFSNPLTVRSRSSFLFRQWKFFELYVRTCPAMFFLFIRVIKFLVTLDLPHSKMTSSLLNWLLFTLIQKDKVKWVCVTLNEDYWRAANRGSKKLYRFLIKI